MTPRKKRLQKGLDSLDKQIKLHVYKLEHAKDHGNVERVEYYEKEIEKFKRVKIQKKKIIDKL